MDDLQPVEIEKEPIGRSRAGDFVFGAFVGIIAIISAIMLGELGAGPAITIISFFLLALCLRYFTLRHAPVVAIGVDVTEEELAILKRMRTLVGALPQPVMILDGESIVEMVNPACIKMFGEDLIDKHISSFIRSPKALDVLRNARRQNAFTEAEFTSTGATERTHLFYAAPLDQDRLHGDGRMIVMIRDRTKQKKLEQMRTDFVANASHELRTPLTSMGGFIETLQGHAKDDPIAQEKFLNIMARQTNRMLRLVEDLIGLSAIELNEAKPLTDMVDLDEVAGAVAETLTPMALKQNIDFELIRSQTPLWMDGDRLEIFRVVQNLCDNAMKYGAAEGEQQTKVILRVGQGVPPEIDALDHTGESPQQTAVRAGADISELVWLQVQDNGGGIDRNDLPRLTERFYRVNPQLSRSMGGTGLGLAIVKHILQRHQGGLQIASTPNEGATFTCVFPLARSKATPPRLEKEAS